MAGPKFQPEEELKPYEPPLVIHEAPLEVRAGTTLSVPQDPYDPADPLDPAGLWKPRKRKW